MEGLLLSVYTAIQTPIAGVLESMLHPMCVYIDVYTTAAESPEIHNKKIVMGFELSVSGF